MRGSSLIKICISPSNSRPNKAFVRQSFRRCYNSSCSVRPNDTQNSVVSSLHVKRRKKRFVRVVEVGPRDGLQNESKIVPSSDKISFIQMLAAAGCPAIEAASFVSPRWVPTMADAATVMEGVRYLSSSSLALSCLVPNLLGCQRALMAGASELAVVISPSETFSLKNMNCSIKESLARCREVAHAATDIPLRGYVTCVWGCPFEGPVSLDQVTRLAEILLEMGCYQVSLGDTIGVGTPHKTVSIVRALQRAVGNDKLAVHFHDTYGQGVANTYAAVCEGIGTVDTSVGGLGGCPYAFGASGNVATEDVVYMLEGMGIETGIDLTRLVAADVFIHSILERPSGSKVAAALSKSNRGLNFHHDMATNGLD